MEKMFSGHKDTILTLSILEDESRLISAGKDREMKIWNLETGTLEKNIDIGHRSFQDTCVLGNTGKIIVHRWMTKPFESSIFQ